MTTKTVDVFPETSASVNADFTIFDFPESDKAFKSIEGGVKSINQAEGIVEAFVAAIGNKDSVGDIIVPGAFEKSLRRRKPRVVWGHDWNAPIGKVLSIEEIPAGSSRLPNKMKIAGVGGLLAKVQFNLNTERGREAFASVAFFGEDQEWSIGYKTIDKDYDHGRQANILKTVELYEVSPVLHGANNLTGTVSVKSEDWMDSQETDRTGDLLPNALEAHLGYPVRLRFNNLSRAVYEDPEGNAFSIKFQFDKGMFLFGYPSPVRVRTIVEPLPDDSHAGCSCGMHRMGKEDSDWDTKVGRMLNMSNQEKLRQAIDLLNQIIAASSPATPEGEGVVIGGDARIKSEYLQVAESSTAMAYAIGSPERLSGLVVHLGVKSLEEAADVVEFLEPTIDFLDIAAVVPTARSFVEKKDNRISLYLPASGDTLKTQLAPLVNVLVDLVDIPIEHEKLDFFGLNSKSFAEVFSAKKISV